MTDMVDVSVPVIRNILDAQNKIAEMNRQWFNAKRVFAINLMSGPGAGKTTLLEKTISRLKHKYSVAVIEGDIQSSEDAIRVRQAGAQAIQINTGGACHLDANMIQSAIGNLVLDDVDILIIENVGNLVCPAEFDLGEHKKIMILSVTEGDDKPLKYPLMFQKSSALIISKIDLLPYVNCDMDKIKAVAANLNPHQTVFALSSKTEEGLASWIAWLEKEISDFKSRS